MQVGSNLHATVYCFVMRQRFATPLQNGYQEPRRAHSDVVRPQLLALKIEFVGRLPSRKSQRMHGTEAVVCGRGVVLPLFRLLYSFSGNVVRPL